MTIHIREFKITKACRKDLNALVALEQLSFKMHDYPLSRRQFNYYINHGRNVFLVVKVHKTLVGYTLLLLRKNSIVARLYSIALHPEYQGMGLASRLIIKAEQKIRTLKKQIVCLEVGIDNYTALNCYKKLGFNVIAKLSGFYANGTDALKMEKKL